MKMKKYLIVIALPFMFGCNGGNKETANAGINMNTDSVSVVNGELSGQLQDKEAIINGFLKSFNEIQQNLNAIKSKQQAVALETEGVERKKTPQEQIVSDIQFINGLLEKNRMALSTLTEKLKNSDIKNEELDITVSNLNVQVNEKEEEINFLKNRLSSLNYKLNDVDAAYQKEMKESAAKTEKLNTAYCSIGTTPELTKQGIITKKGGFVGAGKLKELDANVAKGMFSPIDIYQTKEISIAARKAKMITGHTKGSYRFEDKYHLKTLIILNPDEFWKTSRYLVIEVSGDEPVYE